jgi:magnesium chelatase family protein
LLDPIDIHLDLPRVEYDKLSDKHLGEPSAAIQKRVEVARQRERQRFSAAANQPTDGSQAESSAFDLNGSGIKCNTYICPAEVRQSCELDETSLTLVRSARSQL